MENKDKLYPPLLEEPPDEPEPIYNEEQQEYLRKRNRVSKCKVVALKTLGYNPFTTNIKLLSQNQKKVLVELCKSMYEEEKDIDNEFNEIVCDYIQSTDKYDYTTLPIFNRPVPN